MTKLAEIICLAFLFVKSGKCEENNTVQPLPSNIFHFSRSNAGLRYRLSLKLMTYYEARDTCTLAGSILVEPRTTQQGQFLYDMLIKSKESWNISRNLNFWIGLKLNRTNREHQFWISDNTSLANTNYSNWARAEPRTVGAFCVQLWGDKTWKWDDTYCDTYSAFICQDQDPTTYTPLQAKELTQSIVGLQNKTNINQGTVSLLSSQLSTLLDVSSQNFDEQSSHDVLVAVETVTNHYNVSQGNLRINRKNVGIEIEDLTNEAEYTGEGGTTLGEPVSGLEQQASEVYLSHNLLHEARNKYNLNTLQVGAVLYRKNSLFVEQQNQVVGNTFGEGPTRHVTSDVISHVLSVEVKNAEMKDLSSAVITRHVVPLTRSGNFSSDVTNTSSDVMQRRATVKCVYWDLNSDLWSEAGCEMESRENVTDGYELITCSCNHMTPFGVILSIDEFYHPPYLISLTIAGCSVSIACLLATVFTYLYFKHLRSKLPQQVLIHLCCSLLFLNIAFLIGIERMEFPTFCFVITVILHYAVLLSWAWMLAEAVLLFRTLVLAKTGSGHENRFIWIASVLCYGVPAGFVAVLANTLDLADYKSDRYCWITSAPLLYSVVIPVGAILFTNLIIFAIIMYNITFRSKNFRQNIDLQRISVAVRRALCMIFVLGLPWIFGFMMLLSKDDDTKTTFSLLFTIFNAFQGLFIFVLFCVRQESVRSAWTKPFSQRYGKTLRLFRSRGPPRKLTGSDGATENERTNQSREPKRSAPNRNATIHTNVSLPSMDEVQVDHRRPPVPKKPLPPPPLEKPKPFRSGWN